MGREKIATERKISQGKTLFYIGIANSFSSMVMIFLFVLLLQDSVSDLREWEKDEDIPDDERTIFDAADDFAESSTRVFAFLSLIGIILFSIPFLSYIWLIIGGFRMSVSPNKKSSYPSLSIPVLFILFGTMFYIFIIIILAIGLFMGLEILSIFFLPLILQLIIKVVSLRTITKEKIRIG